jgi:hypothetical protein
MSARPHTPDSRPSSVLARIEADFPRSALLP